ncbi:MAG: MotA/TolQ/ExbB proton channel family protein [Thiotrichaceae bacterium]
MDLTEFLLNIFHKTPDTMFISSLNPMSAFILVLLIIMSLSSWYVIFRKISQLLLFFYYRPRWQQFLVIQIKLNNELLKQPTTLFSNPFATLFHYTQTTLAGYPAAILTPEWIARTVRMGLQQEKIRLETGLSWLASISSTAPFLGLLGTVIEIYITLNGLGGENRMSLDVIAPPIGHALILTATGLAVAIPAALGYNALLRLQRIFWAQLDNFGQQLHILLILKGIS